MQRFFFHFVSPDDLVRDELGVMLADLAAAHAHAMRLVRELIPVLPEADRRKWRIDICNEAQSHLVTVLFPVSTAKPKSTVRAADRTDVSDPNHPRGSTAAAFGRRR